MIKLLTLKIKSDLMIMSKIPKPEIFKDILNIGNFKHLLTKSIKEVKLINICYRYTVFYIFELDIFYRNDIENPRLEYIKNLISPIMNNDINDINNNSKHDHSLNHIIKKNKDISNIKSELLNNVNLLILIFSYNYIYSEKQNNIKSLGNKQKLEIKFFIEATFHKYSETESEINKLNQNGLEVILYCCKKIQLFLQSILAVGQETPDKFLKNDFKVLKIKIQELEIKLNERLNLFKNSKLEKTKVLIEILKEKREELQDLGNSEIYCFIYYLLMLLEHKDSIKISNRNENIFVKFIQKLIDFIFRSSLYYLDDKTLKINKFFLTIITHFINFFCICKEEGKDLSLLLKKYKLNEIQVRIYALNIKRYRSNLLYHMI